MLLVLGTRPAVRLQDHAACKAARRRGAHFGVPGNPVLNPIRSQRHLRGSTVPAGCRGGGADALDPDLPFIFHAPGPEAMGPPQALPAAGDADGGTAAARRRARGLPIRRHAGGWDGRVRKPPG